VKWVWIKREIAKGRRKRDRRIEENRKRTKDSNCFVKSEKEDNHEKEHKKLS